MGSAMIERLLEQGQAVIGYDPSPAASDTITELGAEAAENLESLAAQSSMIILSLPTAAIVRAAMDELHDHIGKGMVVLDASTSEPDTSKALAKKAAGAGYFFVDGPVSGGPGGARAGTMTMILGGDAEAVEKAKPVMKHLTGKYLHIGPSGSGHVAKIANNLLCAANLALVSEMSRLAESQGVSLQSLLEGVNAGSGRSGVSEVNFPLWIQTERFDSGFTMGLMRKDVGLAVKLAASSNLNLPATQSIVDLWEASRTSIDDSADFNEIYRYESNV